MSTLRNGPPCDRCPPARAGTGTATTARIANARISLRAIRHPLAPTLTFNPSDGPTGRFMRRFPNQQPANRTHLGDRSRHRNRRAAPTAHQGARCPGSLWTRPGCGWRRPVRVRHVPEGDGAALRRRLVLDLGRTGIGGRRFWIAVAVLCAPFSTPPPAVAIPQLFGLLSSVGPGEPADAVWR